MHVGAVPAAVAEVTWPTAQSGGCVGPRSPATQTRPANHPTSVIPSASEESVSNRPYLAHITPLRAF